MPAMTAAFRMADRMLDGRLEALMRESVQAGMPFEYLSRHLYATGGVEVTGQTLRRWAKQLGIEANKAEVA